jgi:hypothetical protein
VVAAVEGAAPVDAYSIAETSLAESSSAQVAVNRWELPWIVKTSLKDGSSYLRGYEAVGVHVLQRELEHTWPRTDP